MKRFAEAGDERHPIQVVSRKTGLNPGLIRAWERRYAVVVPSRTATGRRMYSDADVQRLLLLKEAMDGGRRIGDVAGLPREELEELIRGDRIGPLPAGGPSGGAVPDMEACITATMEMNAEALRGTLARAAAARGTERFVLDLAAPFLRRIGELWGQGSLDPGQEHFASSAVRTALLGIIAASGGGRDAPCLVATTPSGEHHEIGALMTGALAAALGWRILYLGPDLPAADIARAAARSGARAVALSIVYRADTPTAIRGEVDALGRLLDDDVTLLIGGAGAEELDVPRTVLVKDAAALAEILGGLVGNSAAGSAATM